MLQAGEQHCGHAQAEQVFAIAARTDRHGRRTLHPPRNWHRSTNG